MESSVLSRYPQVNATRRSRKSPIPASRRVCLSGALRHAVIRGRSYAAVSDVRIWASLVTEALVELGQKTGQVVHLLGTVHQQIASAGLRVAQYPGCDGTHRFRRHTGSVADGDVRSPIQNRDRISDPSRVERMW